MSEQLFVIRKGGYYYRPNAQGYTASLHEAGRYPEAEAIAHMEASDPGEITIFPAPVVPVSLTLPQDIAATAERVALEHIATGSDMDGLAAAIAAALEAERARNTTPPAQTQPVEVQGAEDLGSWLPIDRADRTIVHQQHFPSINLTIRKSDRYWVRDEDGRVYEASWTEGDNGRNYWWDWDAESPVDPVEFMPHPLDPRFAALHGSEKGE